MGTALQPAPLSSPPPQSSTFSVRMSFLFPAFQAVDGSEIRQNYYQECETLVNKQINQHFHAGYVYTALANFFTQVDQALPGFACYFKRASYAVNHHGVNMMEYQAKRGGKVVLEDICKPTRMEWGTPVEAMTAVLELEKTVTQTLQDLQAVAAEKKDFHLCDFIQKELVVKKVNIIQEIEKAVVTQTLVDLQAVVSSVKHCHVNTSQVE